MKKHTTAERLKTIMQERDLKQADILRLAEPYCVKYGIPLRKNDLSQYVNGKNEPGQFKLTILAQALDVSEAWLMGYDVPMARAKYISLDDLDSADCTSDDTIFYETSAKIRLNEDMKEILRDYCEKNGIEYSFEDTSSIDKMFLYSSTHVDELKQSIMEMLEKLDDIDKAEIRGEMRQMLKADKYNKAEPKNA